MFNAEMNRRRISMRRNRRITERIQRKPVKFVEGRPNCLMPETLDIFVAKSTEETLQQ